MVDKMVRNIETEIISWRKKKNAKKVKGKVHELLLN